MTYRALLTDPTVDRDALLRLWADNLPVRGDVAAKLQWLYLDGPAGRTQAFLVRAPEPDDKAVGCTAVGTRELWAGGRRVHAALFGDFAIDREHRNGLAAVVLQRAVKRHVDAAFDASYGMPNMHALAVYRRIGYRELGKMARYVRVLRHGGYLERRLTTHGPGPAGLHHAEVAVAHAAGAMIDGAQLVVEHARGVRPALDSSLVWLEDFDTRFDRLWVATRDRFGIASRRDSAFLHWRFLRKPDERDAIAALVHRGSDALRAYAVVRGRPGEMAEIVDTFGPFDGLDDLLTLLVPALHHRGHTAVGFRFLGDPWVAALFEAHHFSLRDAERAVILARSASCPIEAITFFDPSAWYLTDLDEDT